MTDTQTIREVVLNNHDFETKKDLLHYIGEALAFPEYYGANLDALADCLSEVEEPVRIRIKRTWHQDSWFKAAAKVIREAAKDNPAITVR